MGESIKDSRPLKDFDIFVFSSYIDDDIPRKTFVKNILIVWTNLIIYKGGKKVRICILEDNSTMNMPLAVRYGICAQAAEISY